MFDVQCFPDWCGYVRGAFPSLQRLPSLGPGQQGGRRRGYCFVRAWPRRRFIKRDQATAERGEAQPEEELPGQTFPAPGRRVQY